jgi:hypothetical protein
MKNIEFKKHLKRLLESEKNREVLKRMILKEDDQAQNCDSAYKSDTTKSLATACQVPGCLKAGCSPKSGSELKVPGITGTVAVCPSTKFPNYPYAILAPFDLKGQDKRGALYYMDKNLTAGNFMKDGVTNQVFSGFWSCAALNDLINNTSLPIVSAMIGDVQRFMNKQPDGTVSNDAGKAQVLTFDDGRAAAAGGYDLIGNGYKTMKVNDLITNVIKDKNLQNQINSITGVQQYGDKTLIYVKTGLMDATTMQNRSGDYRDYWVKEMKYIDGKCPLSKGPNGEDPVDCQEYDLSNSKFNTRNAKDFSQGQYFVHKYMKLPGSEDILKLKQLAQAATTSGNYTKESCKEMFTSYVKAYETYKAQISTPVMQEIKLAIQGCNRAGINYKVLGLFGGLDKKLDKLQYNAKLVDSMGRVTDYSLADNAGANELRESHRDRELKNLIRESLLDIKRTKKKINLGESKIINSRIKLISEHRTLKTKPQKEKFFRELMMEMAYLNSQGYSSKLINENFLDMLKGLFGTAADSTLQYFKESIAKWLIEKLTPMEPNGWMANIIIAAVGNVPIGEISRLTECNYLSDVLTKSIVEGAVNKYKNEQGLTGPFYDILRNGIIEMLEDTKFGQVIETAIGDLVCPLLGGIKDKMTSASDSMKKGALSLT